MKYLLVTFYIFISLTCLAQDSILVNKETDVVISGTRTLTSKNQLAVPVLVIDNKRIAATGALKLNDILAEQSGIVLTNGTGSRAVGGGIFGNGVQLQGMSPDHVLILVDGEPIIGKNGGTLDVSRLAVANVKQIEIIKGPFSSLYGSEAMGGVINLITENPKLNQYAASLRYGSFNSFDIQNRIFWVDKKQKTKINIFVNNYSSKGYDLNKSDAEKTLDPLNNHTIQLQIASLLSKKLSVKFNQRFFTANQQSNYAINSNTINIGGNATTNDYNSFVSFAWQPTTKWQPTLNIQYNQYQYNQQLDSLANKSNYYQDAFKQQFIRIEQLNNINLSKKLQVISGVGYTWQIINTDRYLTKANQNAAHIFTQTEWQPFTNTKISTGIRADFNSDFEKSINPKLAVKQQLSKNTQLYMSFGTGFKAPDFRQLYLDFINNAADSYIIYGTEKFSYQRLQQQLANGFIAQILPSANQIIKLRPEQSQGFNLGLNKNIGSSIKLNASMYYNKIVNLIQYIEVARRPNGAPVYSYINVNNAFTKGGEIQLQYQINKNWQLETNYQYLKSGDVAIQKQLNEGKVYGRNSVGGSAILLNKNAYQNLQGRSTHLAQAKITYSINEYQIYVRGIYRSKWGVTDLDGNGFANMDAEFAKANLLLNIAAQKSFDNKYKIQFGIQNITNYTDPLNMTNIPGINGYISFNYLINNKNSKK
jgi:outer membrane receptor for ferrienterochelin and colicins